MQAGALQAGTGSLLGLGHGHVHGGEGLFLWASTQSRRGRGTGPMANRATLACWVAMAREKKGRPGLRFPSGGLAWIGGLDLQPGSQMRR
ncbi:hypothetical protein GCM10028789_25490 [Sinomonas halotolerans]